LIVKKVDGLYYALMQAKAEPGNVDGTQIAPTVQATRSNYMRVHGGKLPLFVERFLGRAKRKVIYEGLQSEEGARFWKKNNLNIVLEVGAGELEDLPAEFRWMTLYQLKRLLLKSNVVNISARSVLACLP
jgi:oxidase EvaA